MSRVLPNLKAVWAFVKALFRRTDPVIGTSARGYTVLPGWTESPEEGILREIESESRRALPPAKSALFCFQGPSSGRTFLLGDSLENLGCSPMEDVVVTPEAAPSRYRFFVNGTTKLVAETGGDFTLNGREEHLAVLYDFDELSLMGNKFLVFDLSSGREEH